MSAPAPLIAHTVYRFDTGGLENGVVNLINHLPPDRFRHMVIALTEVTEFRRRLNRDDVECVALNKPPGHGAKVYPRMWALLRDRRPAIVHSRNLAALEMQVPAWFARVPVRIHGEHGRDLNDLGIAGARYTRVRRLYSPFVHRYVALSQDLSRYLQRQVGIPDGRIAQIYNGVDTDRFRPADGVPVRIEGCPFTAPEHWLFGTVGRMQAIKDQTLMARAFVRALELQPGLRDRLRLVMIGDGPLRPEVLSILERAGVGDLAWLPGERSDVADVMRGLNAFVLPSLSEGISNSMLEAMASGLPVIATGVGGNTELVAHRRTGEIVPPSDPQAMADAMLRMAAAPRESLEMGRAARLEVERRYSLKAMVAAYQGLYEQQLASAGHVR